MKTIKHSFPTNLFYKKPTIKRGIVLHHTTSGKGVSGDIRWWKSQPQRVCTPIIIDRKGGKHRLFSSRFWAHHLGIKSYVFRQFGLAYNNVKLNKQFIGVEIDSWGGLVKRKGKFYSWVGTEIPEDRVVHYPNGFRGYFYFEKYTDEQILSLKELLIYWGNYYNIDISYKGYHNVFELSEDALKGEEGVYSHVSFRPDKSDCHPQTELIQMLKSL